MTITGIAIAEERQGDQSKRRRAADVLAQFSIELRV
jgi:hypothetical protein